jgi:hypothetical protein
MPCQDINMININKKDLLRRSLYYFIPFIAGLVYWLAFYPGFMSFDSIFQWDQLSTFKFTNWHPAIHTILMYVLSRIWYSPAIVSLFQIMIACLIIGYGLNTIRKASRLPDYVLITLGVLISINPIVGIMDITLWKDVLYSLAVLLLTIFLFEIITSEGKWLSKPLNIVFYGAILSSIWLLRYNGAPVVIASLIITPVFYKKYLRPIIYSSLVTIMLIIIIRGPIYDLFKVDKSDTQSYGVSFLNPVNAYVNNDPHLQALSEEEKQYLNQIYPLNISWPYSCYDATILFYEGVNFSPINQDPMMLVSIFTKLAVRNPEIMFNHFVCVSSFVWQLNQPKDVYYETILLDSYNPEQVQSWSKYDSLVIQPSLLPRIRSVIKRLVTYEWNADAYKVIWRPALYMYLFLGSLAFLTYKTKYKIWLLLSVPLVAQSVGIMFTTQLQALRYQYAVYLISMLFTIPILWMGIKYVTSTPKQNLDKNNF